MTATRGARLPAARACLLAALIALPWAAHAVGAGDGDDRAEPHHFAVLGYSAGKGGDGEDRLKEAIAAADDKATSFLVVTGIKAEKEGCGDQLYQKRRELLDEAHRPVIVVPAGSDWTGCVNSAGRTSAVERLNRLRELLYGEPGALGTGKLALTRQSSSPRFRSYAENAHWLVGDVLYASLNLPAANNHFLNEAGRNSEYEDRLVANRFWLNRLFAIARRDKLVAIVLFSDGDLKAQAQPTGLRALLRRAVPDNDGFAETRRQVLLLAQKFSGKVLLVDSAPATRTGVPAIDWHGNLGHLSTGRRALEVEVEPGAKRMFTVRAEPQAQAQAELQPESRTAPKSAKKAGAR